MTPPQIAIPCSAEYKDKPTPFIVFTASVSMAGNPVVSPLQVMRVWDDNGYLKFYYNDHNGDQRWVPAIECYPDSKQARIAAEALAKGA